MTDGFNDDDQVLLRLDNFKKMLLKKFGKKTKIKKSEKQTKTGRIKILLNITTASTAYVLFGIGENQTEAIQNLLKNSWPLKRTKRERIKRFVRICSQKISCKLFKRKSYQNRISKQIA